MYFSLPCDAKQFLFSNVEEEEEEEEGERNRKIERRSHWEFRAERCLSSALGGEERAIEVRRETENS